MRSGEREEQFLRAFWQAWPCAVLGGQLWMGHPTVTIQKFLNKVFKGLVLLGTNKTGETKLNEGKQIIAVRFECVFYSASSVNRNHCAQGETYVAAKGWAVTVVRNAVPSDL